MLIAPAPLAPLPIRTRCSKTKTRVTTRASNAESCYRKQILFLPSHDSQRTGRNQTHTRTLRPYVYYSSSRNTMTRLGAAKFLVPIYSAEEIRSDLGFPSPATAKSLRVRFARFSWTEVKPSKKVKI